MRCQPHRLHHATLLLNGCADIGAAPVHPALQPFFSPVVGLVGSITYFPLCVLFPCLMWAKVRTMYGRCALGGWRSGAGMLQPACGCSTLIAQTPLSLLPLHDPSPPFVCQVYKPQGLYLRVMKGVCWSMLFVALGAIVGSVQALIDSWAHGFTLFD